MLPPFVHELLFALGGVLVTALGWAFRELHGEQKKHDTRIDKLTSDLRVAEEKIARHAESLHALDGRARVLEDRLAEVAADVKVSRQILEELKARREHRRKPS